MKKIDFSWRFQCCSSSENEKLFKYLLTFPTTERSGVILKALNSFYLVDGFARENDLTEDILEQKAIQCVLELLQQADIIYQKYNLSSSNFQKTIEAFFLRNKNSVAEKSNSDQVSSKEIEKEKQVNPYELLDFGEYKNFIRHNPRRN